MSLVCYFLTGFATSDEVLGVTDGQRPMESLPDSLAYKGPGTNVRPAEAPMNPGQQLFAGLTIYTTKPGCQNSDIVQFSLYDCISSGFLLESGELYFVLQLEVSTYVCHDFGSPVEMLDSVYRI